MLSYTVWLGMPGRWLNDFATKSFVALQVSFLASSIPLVIRLFLIFLLI